MAEPTTTRTRKRLEAEGPEEPARHDGAVCSVAFCPIGLALGTVNRASPELTEHLLSAGREFLLAAKAVIDARAADIREGGKPTKLERIEIA